MNPGCDCVYHFCHLWVRKLENEEALVGISLYAKNQLGEIAYVDSPAMGVEIVQGIPFGVVESMKVVSELVAPASGKVLETNTRLQSEISLINEDPEGDGWILRIKLANPEELSGLLSQEQYTGQFGT